MFLSTVDLGWSSFDYIQVGGKQTNAEYKAQISMFAILAAPIFIGTDLRGIDDASLAVYSSTEMLAIHQVCCCGALSC